MFIALVDFLLKERGEEPAIVPSTGESLCNSVIQAILDCRELELLYIFGNELVIGREVVRREGLHPVGSDKGCGINDIFIGDGVIPYCRGSFHLLGKDEESVVLGP